jgi:hypothetical protein
MVTFWEDDIIVFFVEFLDIIYFPHTPSPIFFFLFRRVSSFFLHVAFLNFLFLPFSLLFPYFCSPLFKIYFSGGGSFVYPGLNPSFCEQNTHILMYVLHQVCKHILNDLYNTVFRNVVIPPWNHFALLKLFVPC